MSNDSLTPDPVSSRPIVLRIVKCSEAVAVRPGSVYAPCFGSGEIGALRYNRRTSLELLPPATREEGLS